ncbi:hypothetical protein ERO13_A06G082300v2 [Gossypium hirsutum]|uniref:Transcription factor MYB114 n=1 Tax=Gossypium hirsutum TaxID=3635 RepID=A0A1U8PUN0_GOSHI|nr:transcription factor MYB114 [Gossypium hirsutum]KAG4194970.1 hypothetical protein ERO13_A06G082300v2 [Gossypium hirsutum]
MAMAPVTTKCKLKEVNRGAWTAEEDQKLAQVIDLHGPKRWKSIAAKAGLKRSGKSCRLRWMNYLRPNIKKGNISDQEEDLILRLHKLLGNRWSLIAGRLPGRTDNQIKNYWNSHLSKKIKLNENRNKGSEIQEPVLDNSKGNETVFVPEGSEEGTSKRGNDYNSTPYLFGDTMSDFHSAETLNWEWMSQFFEINESWVNVAYDII